SFERRVLCDHIETYYLASGKGKHDTLVEVGRCYVQAAIVAQSYECNTGIRNCCGILFTGSLIDAHQLDDNPHQTTDAFEKLRRKLADEAVELYPIADTSSRRSY